MARYRFAAVSGAAWIAVGLVACSQPHMVASTASVKINEGAAVRAEHVRCKQVEWLVMMDITGNGGHARLLVDESAAAPTLKSVHFQNFGGFTGMYSVADGGSGQLISAGGSYRVTGVADGFNTDHPNQPASAKYEITARC